jgi:hypothetical protein
MPPYVQEFKEALERAERLGLGAAPVRLVVRVVDAVASEVRQLAKTGLYYNSAFWANSIRHLNYDRLCRRYL